MAWELDLEVAAAMAPLLEMTGAVEPPPVGDVETRRALIDQIMGAFISKLHVEGDVTVSEHAASPDVPLRLYAPEGSAGGALALYIHGGGMIAGSVALYDPLLRSLASRSGIALLAVEYRLAPEHPHPTPTEDCYAALQWAADNAAELGYDPARLGVVGDSGGGGLAAATALVARDRGRPQLAGQVLIYPMLDDRNTIAPASVPDVLVWTYEDNATGWNAVLEGSAGGTGVSPYAAPARAEDLAGLPPTYISVGGLDIFRDEDIDYGARLSAAGVPVELHVLRGGPHGFDFFAPDSGIGSRALDGQVRALRAL